MKDISISIVHVLCAGLAIITVVISVPFEAARFRKLE